MTQVEDEFNDVIRWSNIIRWFGPTVFDLEQLDALTCEFGGTSENIAVDLVRYIIDGRDIDITVEVLCNYLIRCNVVNTTGFNIMIPAFTVENKQMEGNIANYLALSGQISGVLRRYKDISDNLSILGISTGVTSPFTFEDLLVLLMDRLLTTETYMNACQVNNLGKYAFEQYKAVDKEAQLVMHTMSQIEALLHLHKK